MPSNEWTDRPIYQDRRDVPRATLSLIGINILAFLVSAIMGGRIAGYIGLDMNAVDNWQVWRFLTYGFIYGVSIGAVIQFSINLFIFWWVGRTVEEERGKGFVFSLYFTSVIFGGVVTTLLMQVLKSGYENPVLANGMPGYIALLIFLACLHPGMEVAFLALFPMKMVTTAIIVVGINLAFFAADAQKGFMAPVPAIAAAGFALMRFFTDPRIESMAATVELYFRRARIVRRREMDKEIDRLLDKISRMGKSSLTDDEVRFLERASKHYTERK